MRRSSQKIGGAVLTKIAIAPPTSKRALSSTLNPLSAVREKRD